MLKIVVCVSGGGTNLQAILDAIDSGRITNTQVLAVISNNAGAKALERARDHGIEARALSPRKYPDREAFNQAFTEEMEKLSPDLIVLAGFLVRIPPQMVAAFSGRIVNIHPSLIPSFCGVGYYGLKVHEKALERGVKVTGATVHFVNDGMDEGPIIAQKAVDVEEGDTPETLQRRVMEQAEWILLPQAIDDIANDRIHIIDNKAMRRK
ncbi:MAG: phosphoribosylglycinamide formyltransferase [Lachnospiraceae bacterium]|jgi:phosphoribosylglycinamide formyltransferase-1|nr:phosphoribosylglycinamide formyltransferase [uncultured Acetatifactor sp.]MCI9229981.1 phosphoribosylglycinamide formyltransferase [Lachnospiraceae bacterium]